MNKDFEFEWNYHNHTDKYPVASFDGKRINVDGEFGSIELTVSYDEGNLQEASHFKYDAKKITFTFAEEHVVVPCGDQS